MTIPDVLAVGAAFTYALLPYALIALMWPGLYPTNKRTPSQAGRCIILGLALFMLIAPLISIADYSLYRDLHIGLTLVSSNMLLPATTSNHAVGYSTTKRLRMDRGHMPASDSRPITPPGRLGKRTWCP